MKVKFLPNGEEFEIELNETILSLAQRNDIHIQSVCKGLPSCAECKIQISEGEHHVSPPSSKEIALIGTAHYVDLSRLSCQLRCFGDVTVNLQEQIDKAERMSSRGRERKDGQESKAVLGSIVEEFNDADFDSSMDSESSNKSGRRPKKTGSVKPLDNKNAFYGSFIEGGKDEKKSSKSGNRNRKKKKKKKNRGGNSAGGGQSKQASNVKGTPAGEGGGKKKRRRRRSNNRPKATSSGE